MNEKIGILNCELSKIIAGLGHGQQLLVGDAAFPIPKSLECVDLALTEGKVSIEETLRAILIELKVEKIHLQAPKKSIKWVEINQ